MLTCLINYISKNYYHYDGTYLRTVIFKRTMKTKKFPVEFTPEFSNTIAILQYTHTWKTFWYILCKLPTSPKLLRKSKAHKKYPELFV